MRTALATLTALLVVLTFPVKADISGELGFTMGEDRAVPQYQLLVTDKAGPLVFSFSATEDAADEPAIALAMLTAHWGWGSVGIGRIGIPLGLTPPLYAIRREPASTPSVTGAFSRAAMSVFGIPDNGISIGLSHGRLEARISLYHTRPASLTETVNIIELFGLEPEGNANVTVPILTPDECTTCNTITQLTGFGDPDGGFTPFLISVWQEAFQGLGLTDPANQEVQINTEDVVRAFSLYYAGPRGRWSVDHVQLELLGQSAEYTVLGAEYSLWNVTVGVQGVETGATSGGIAYLVAGWRSFEAYYRAGKYTGTFPANESEYGLIWHIDRYSLKLSHEKLEATINETHLNSDIARISASVSF